MERFLYLKTSTRQQLIKWLPLIIIFLAALLRFHLIEQQSLWNDEGNTLRLIERPIPDLIVATGRDIHPPGYYLALKLWWMFTGDSEFSLRAFSAFAGLLTVACTYALGRALFAPGAGLIAALFVALNSFNIYYSQEARMYALLALLASASMLVFVQWLARPTQQLVIVLALVNAAGLYTQYTYPFVMIAQGVLFVLFWFRTRNSRLLANYIVLNILTLLLFAPLLPTALQQVTAWPRTGEAVDPLAGLGVIAQWLIYGNTATGLSWIAYIWPTVFGLTLFIPDWRKLKQPEWWRRFAPLIWLLITVIPLFVFGLFREANLKFLLPAQIAMALIIGRGVWLLWELGSPHMAILIEAMPRLVAAVGLLSMLSYNSASLDSLYTDPAFFRSDYRAIARLITENFRDGDAIILDAPNQREVFTYYYQGDATIYPLPEGLGGDDTKTASQVSNVIDKHSRIFVLYWGEAERDPNRIVEKTLASRAFEVYSIWYGDVRFVQYATMPRSMDIKLDTQANFGVSITLESASLSSTELHPGDVLGVTLNWSTSAILTNRYKVFVQLLNSSGQLVAQHDSEPGNNMALTTTWKPGEIVNDSHGLFIPRDVASGIYTLIVGLYNVDSPQSRLPVGDKDHLTLARVKIQ